nr:hypothetical protein SHINE37_42483 [Rhizobiaceae bacterium]
MPVSKALRALETHGTPFINEGRKTTRRPMPARHPRGLAHWGGRPRKERPCPPATSRC